MSDTLTIHRVIEICKSRSKHVSLFGSKPEQVLEFKIALTKAGLMVQHCTDNTQIKLFSTVVVLELDNVDCIYDYTFLNSKTPYNGRESNSIVDVFDQFTIKVNNPVEQLQLPTEVFVFRGGDVMRLPCEQAQLIDDYERAFFKKELLACVPSLEQHSSKIYVVYAGATSEHTITRLLFDTLIADIRRGLRLGYTKVVFYNGDETMQEPGLYTCQRAAEYFKDELPENTLFYFTSGLESQEYYQETHDAHGFSYQMVMIAALRFEQGMKSNRGLERMCELWKPYRVGTREKNYVCFNRVPRWHRVVLFTELLDQGLVEDSFYSFDNDHINTVCCPQDVTERAMGILDAHNHMLPLVLNRSEQNDNPVSITLEDVPYHSNSYFSVVTETMFYSGKYKGWSDVTNIGTTFFSEKIFKPLCYKHPFILVGKYGSLAWLREFGYKTFHPYINEEYDNIVDDVDRMNAIVAEIKRLCSQTSQEWAEWQHSIKDIVEHNFEHFFLAKDLCVTKDIEQYFR